MAQTFTKRLAEALNYAFEFNTHAAIVAGDTLSSVVSVVSTVQGPTGATNLTVGTGTIFGTQVLVRISGGQDDARYEVEFTALTAGGQEIVGIGYLRVNDT